jgi:hypothetical protein
MGNDIENLDHTETPRDETHGTQRIVEILDVEDRVSASANEGALANVRYCSEKCDRQWNNRETYKRHRAETIARNLRNQKRTAKKK